VVPDSDYRIKLQVFEGPLDLLLFLIRKNELDIYDIPIESVTRQYIDALHAMQQMDLDVAGEFFVMAATLMEIKSRMLLPKGQHAIDPNADDEEVDPRWELVHQLLQYKKFKEAAVSLAQLVETRQNLMARHVSELTTEMLDRPLKSVDRIELWNVFNIVLRRLAEKLVVGEIHDEVVTVSDQMEWLLERSQGGKSFVFSQLFPEGVTLRRLVATFLAMLELTRLKKLRIRQSEAFTDIVVEAVLPEVPVETTDLEIPIALGESETNGATGELQRPSPRVEPGVSNAAADAEADTPIDIVETRPPAVAFDADSRGAGVNFNIPVASAEPDFPVAAVESEIPEGAAPETAPGDPIPEIEQPPASKAELEADAPPEGTVVEKPLETAPNPRTVTT